MNAPDFAFRGLLVAVAFGLSVAPAIAAPVKIEAAVIAPKAKSKLEFADGSKRFLLATQREGKAGGSGPSARQWLLDAEMMLADRGGEAP